MSLLLIYSLVRHVPVIYVDYPGETSLKQIYGTFNRAMLRIIPSLKPWADSLTNAMVEFFLLSQVNIQFQFFFYSFIHFRNILLLICNHIIYILHVK
jgi:hypothetical protein